MDKETKLIIGRMRLNPLNNEFVPCIEILCNPNGGSEGQLLLLEILGEGRSDWGEKEKIRMLKEEIKELKKELKISKDEE